MGDDLQLTTDEKRKLKALLDEHGEIEVAKRASVNPATISRALAGQGVRRSTITLLRQTIAAGRP